MFVLANVCGNICSCVCCARDKASNILVDSWLANYKTAKGPAGTVSIPRDEGPTDDRGKQLFQELWWVWLRNPNIRIVGRRFPHRIYLSSCGTTIVNACRPLAKPIQQKARVFQESVAASGTENRYDLWGNRFVEIVRICAGKADCVGCIEGKGKI